MSGEMGASYRSGSVYPGSGPSSGLKVERAPNVVTPLTRGWAYSGKESTPQYNNSLHFIDYMLSMQSLT